MYPYSVAQWILFFGWYCLLGWIWESCYLSLVRGIKTKKWKWINRGFLNGPFLPIYGSAAIVILLATIPVKEYTWMVYLAGAIAATLLELITGSTMERLFKVKYWDYSDLPLNFHGYICFFISLFWGLCAVFMTEVIHVPVEGLLLQMPEVITEIGAIVFVAYFAHDFTVSFREAMDMREILEQLTASNESLQKLERRLDAIVAFTAVSDLEEWLEKGRNAKERVLLNIERKREMRISKIRKMREKLLLLDKKEVADKEELLVQLEMMLKNVLSRSNRQYMRVLKHLKRNPGAVSKRYQQALDEIKELLENRK